MIYDLLTNLPNHNVDTIVAATAALKNISIHQGSEVNIWIKPKITLFLNMYPCVVAY